MAHGLKVENVENSKTKIMESLDIVRSQVLTFNLKASRTGKGLLTFEKGLLFTY